MKVTCATRQFTSVAQAAPASSLASRLSNTQRHVQPVITGDRI
jgi:hypothetical protein